MKIRIVSWGYENIRRLNTLDINLQSSSGQLPHVSLIMMRNGTGKTTTITLMRAALSGSAEEWNANQVREFRPVNSSVPEGKFYITVQFGNELYYYCLILNYESGKASYKTSRVGLSGGLEDGHILPMELRNIFNSEGFISRFIFDGEQAKKTLSSGSHEAELAVTYLYQIYKIDTLISQIQSLISKKQTESESRGATPGSLSNNRTRMERRQKTYNDLLAHQQMVSNAIDSLKHDYDELEGKRTNLVASDEKLRQEQEHLIEQKNEEENRLSLILQEIGIEIKKPYQVQKIFDDQLKHLVDNMQTLKLPKSTAREFFRELSESKVCVCGRTIGPTEKQAILDRANNYLGEEDLSAINSIKDKLRRYKSTDDLQLKLNNMVEIKESIQNIHNAIERLVLQLDKHSIQEAEEISKKQEELKRKLDVLTHELKILIAPFGSPNTTDQNNVATARKAYEEANENYLRASGTYEYTQKANILISYLTKVKNCALQKLKNGIVIKTNDKISKIITDEPLVVDRIDGNLVLKDRSSVSEGQTLAIAYSYIGSLFEHSSFEFPFVIDSPAASMDLGVRREVATVIYRLFNQLIIFVTSGEVAGFAEKFYPLNDITYFTIEGQDEGQNAKCTLGKDYFATYQCEEDA